jgi:zinc/manganese transport system permease protein
VLVVLAALWRPLWFSSIDPDGADARGVPTRALTVAFPVVLAATVAETIQVTGVLLILTLLVTPAAAAQRLAHRTATAVALSVVLTVVTTLGGIVASLQWDAPTSFFVALFSFVCYLAARLATVRIA